MRPQALVSFAALVAVSMAFPASASPSALHLKRDSLPWDPKGNVDLIWSDDTTSLGSVSVDDVLQKLKDQCSPDGLCETLDIDLHGTKLIKNGGSGAINDYTITLHPGGTYAKGVHDTLLNALGAAVNAVKTCENQTFVRPCHQTGEIDCDREPETVMECLVPKFWGITYQAGDASTNAPSSITVNMDASVDANGFCKTFTTVGSAVAGAVSGAGGGLFSLLGLACGP